MMVKKGFDAGWVVKDSMLAGWLEHMPCLGHFISRVNDTSVNDQTC